MFLKRLVSGIVLVALAFGFIYRGGVPLLLAVMLLSLIGQYELYKSIGVDHKGMAFIGYAMTLIYYLLVGLEGTVYVTAMIVGSLILMMTAYVITFPEYKTEEVSGVFFGMCYVSVLMSYIYHTRMIPEDGIYVVWLILFSSWGSDTLAYCTGMLIGRRRMAPKLSPHKSWEGAIGGVIGSALLGLIYGLAFRHRLITMSPVISCTFTCAVGAIISMIGDLAASAIKRNHDIKDFGHMIPGHGGVLDRFDSMLFTAPAIYYAFIFADRFL